MTTDLFNWDTHPLVQGSIPCFRDHSLKSMCQVETKKARENRASFSMFSNVAQWLWMVNCFTQDWTANFSEFQNVPQSLNMAVICKTYVYGGNWTPNLIPNGISPFVVQATIDSEDISVRYWRKQACMVTTPKFQTPLFFAWWQVACLSHPTIVNGHPDSAIDLWLQTT